jgi:uncharacterized protein (TIGR03084 family)
MAEVDARASLTLVVEDLRAEGDELFALLADMDTGFWTQHSTFKNWTVWDVVAHLHFSDHMALTSLESADAFKALMREIVESGSARNFTNAWLSPDDTSINGPELLARWRELFLKLCDALAAADPQERFAWAGPGMKARMFATARQMETWAHAWEIYDLMGRQRTHTDRLKNIATIGVRTFGWTFSNRKLPVPELAPYVKLDAPSGAVWEWGDPGSAHQVQGTAVEFCQVVTQTRNIADTQLDVTGDNAVAWMAIAQCFAGPPEEPPAPGSRSR